MRTVPIILVIVLIAIPSIAFAQSPVQIMLLPNKQSYVTGDTISLSGNILSLGASNTAVLQVYDPFNVLVQIGTVNILPDGTFHTTIKAQGTSWNNDGVYKIKVIYISTPILATATANINFKVTKIQPTILQPTIPQSTPSTDTQNNTQIISYNNQTVEEQIKQRIAIANKLKQQLDQGSESQIPFWVKDAAKKWHDGAIDNIEFSKNIHFLISSGMVKVNEGIKSTDVFEHIPSWQKKVTGWWSQGIISDYDYFNSIQFLLDKKIIN